MARKKRITLILIILSTLLLAGPGVVDIANAEPISSSIPTDIERQSVPSTLSPSDSIDDGPAQESVKWNLGWNSFDGNWFYVDSVNPVSLHSGWLYTNGAWYWLDPSTHAMAIGLHECNGSAYWFNGSGAMATGWVLDGGTWYYATGSGALASGWLNLNGAWYWLDPSTHAMATGFHECNGSLYWFNSSGAMATGWVLDGGTWYYATGSGALARGPVSVGGVPYCFDARTGAMLTGYQTDAQGVRRYFGSCGPLNGWGLVDGSWYWFADGIASTGWLYTGGSWYWLDPDAGGAMATGLHACNGSAYWFSASGAMATGWVLDGGTWYYATGSGALASGWLNLNGAWYWLDPSTHAMATGVQTIGSCEYIFNSTGKMMANCWSNGDGSWMYHSSSSGAIDLKGIMTDSGIQLIDDDGNARTGWIESQGARYYCSASGVILTGWQQIAGSWYYFNPDGRMATGWLNDGSNWYWLDSASGAMKTGWLSLGGTWYYLDAARGGVMLSNGWYWIGSTDYKFSSSGAMVGAWVDVPCYLQYPELPTGCESVALTNLLNYYGFGLGKTIIADYYLPKGSNGNFVTAFDGNPRRSSGGLMGCVAPAITIAGNNFLRAAGSIMQAKDVSFSSISSIKNRLTCGQPVEMWNTEWGSWPGGRYAARWYNGHSYGLWGGNHAVVLKGYDDEQGIVYLSDSINGNVTRNAQVFFGTWQQMDSQAVVIE
ncbi:C39 family peptidase [Collinsella sp. CLA-ER-H10]|uniref:C39 family peptidase n=1 Tax=Collinsella sp. CLA-ER-H10 TaxID=3136218 RepID=UPI0032BF386F